MLTYRLFADSGCRSNSSDRLICSTLYALPGLQDIRTADELAFFGGSPESTGRAVEVVREEIGVHRDILLAMGGDAKVRTT